jgi:hypothetical protein
MAALGFVVQQNVPSRRAMADRVTALGAHHAVPSQFAAQQGSSSQRIHL